MFKNKIVLILMSTLLFVGCGYKQTTTQTRDVGYLKFNKSSSAGYRVVINDKYEFMLDQCAEQQAVGQCQDTTSDKLFEVSSGLVAIKVFDATKKLIYKDEIYLGSTNTKEITLP
ncbi:hypothetical protein [Sulfurospirillum sp. UCH001]|uniref:hypothetical protein n=1 Tax=Sulfurospirillum sp. UCH001 TaxID=1581011 RepID=UPI00082E0373|nr:hypothetical protein [Sulfurospirillum sp. UCH001]